MNDAFVSVVEDQHDPNRLLVRARDPEHFERLFPLEEVTIAPRADYIARVAVSREAFASMVTRKVGEIDYPNFKNSVQDRRLRDLYSGVWDLHRAYQIEQTVDRCRHFAWGVGDVVSEPKV